MKRNPREHSPSFVALPFQCLLLRPVFSKNKSVTNVCGINVKYTRKHTRTGTLRSWLQGLCHASWFAPAGGAGTIWLIQPSALCLVSFSAAVKVCLRSTHFTHYFLHNFVIKTKQKKRAGTALSPKERTNSLSFFPHIQEASRISSYCKSDAHLELASHSPDGEHLPGERAEALCPHWATDDTAI